MKKISITVSDSTAKFLENVSVTVEKPIGDVVDSLLFGIDEADTDMGAAMIAEYMKEIIKGQTHAQRNEIMLKAAAICFFDFITKANYTYEQGFELLKKMDI